MTVPILRTKIERIAWYGNHLSRIRDQHNLVNLAANPKREILDINERLVAILVILKDGIKAEDEVKPLLDLVKDENDFPITEFVKKGTVDEYMEGKAIDKDTKEIIDKKENNALLRGEAALALTKNGLKTDEFIKVLADIANSMANDPLFIWENKAQLIITHYFKNFLTALYEVDRNSTLPLIKAFSINEQELKKIYLS